MTMHQVKIQDADGDQVSFADLLSQLIAFQQGAWGPKGPRALSVDALGRPLYQIGSLMSLRPSSVLTTAYVPTPAVDVSQGNQAVFFVDFTLGSLTDALVKFEFSDDGIKWWPKTLGNDASGVVVSDEFQSQQLIDVKKLVPSTASLTPYAFTFPVKARYCRAQLKGEGTVASSLAAIWAYAGVS